MVFRTNIGMNYGHQAVYDASVVESDFTFFSTAGLQRVRIVYPNYNDSTGITHCQDMVQRALNHKFYAIWGVDVSGPITASLWAAYKATLTGSIASWAQSIGLPELSMGNEIEGRVDGTTLTVAQVQADIQTMATTVKSGGYTGKVSYQTQVNQISAWNHNGLGSLDSIGFNCYDTLSNFTNNVQSLSSAFGNHAYVSEFSCRNSGYGDYNAENAWYTDVVNRLSVIEATSLLGYFFCYRDGGDGLGQDTFALQLSNGQTRYAMNALQKQSPCFNLGIA